MNVLRNLMYKAYFYSLSPAEQVEECKLKRSWIRDNLRQANTASAAAVTTQTPAAANPAPNPAPAPVPSSQSVQESCTESVQKPAVDVTAVDVTAVKKRSSTVLRRSTASLHAGWKRI